MPDYFSHYILAEKIYDNLESDARAKIKNKTLYLLGAQGGDVFFAYNLKFSGTNLGREMHAAPAKQLFEKLAQGNKSYLAGFATHYAADSAMHPAIYAYERTKRSPVAHTRFEKDLGLFVSRKYCMRRIILPRESVLACTYAVYDAVKRFEPSITVTGVERCLKRHFNYTRYEFCVKRQTFKCKYDFSTLSSALDDAVDLGVKCVTSALEGDFGGEIFGREFLSK